VACLGDRHRLSAFHADLPVVDRLPASPRLLPSPSPCRVALADRRSPIHVVATLIAPRRILRAHRGLLATTMATVSPNSAPYDPPYTVMCLDLFCFPFLVSYYPPRPHIQSSIPLASARSLAGEMFDPRPASLPPSGMSMALLTFRVVFAANA